MNKIALMIFKNKIKINNKVFYNKIIFKIKNKLFFNKKNKSIKKIYKTKMINKFNNLEIY